MAIRQLPSADVSSTFRWKNSWLGEIADGKMHTAHTQKAWKKLSFLQGRKSSDRTVRQARTSAVGRLLVRNVTCLPRSNPTTAVRACVAVGSSGLLVESTHSGRKKGDLAEESKVSRAVRVRQQTPPMLNA